MAFKGEMSTGYEMNLGIRQIALEGFGTSRDERWIVLTPYSKQMRLMGTEILLELWIECNIRAVVQNQVVLHLGTVWLADIIVIERIAVWTY